MEVLENSVWNTLELFKMKRAIVSLIFLCIICLPLILAFLPMRVTGALELTLTKQSVKTTVGPGETLIYNITVRNIGPAQRALHVWVNDTLPPEVTYVNDTAYTLGSIFNYSILNGSKLELKFWNVQKDMDQNFTITTTVPTNVSDGEILRNTAVMDYTDGVGVNQPAVTAYWNVTVSMPRLTIDKTVTIDTVDPTLATYQIYVNNTGSAEAQYVWLNDSFPTGMEYVSNQTPAGGTCRPQPIVQPTSLLCTRNNFASGNEIWNVTLRITPTVPAGSRIYNWAFLNYTTQNGSMMPQESTSAYFDAQTASLDLKKIAEPRVSPGNILHYTIYYNNTGNLNAMDVWIKDTLPAGVTFVSANPAPTVNTSNRVEWYFSNLSRGSYVIDFDVSASSTLTNGEILSNQVTGEYYDAIGRWRPPQTSIANTTVEVDLPYIRVVKTANVDNIPPGGQVLFMIFYNNTGRTLSSRVTIEDTVPLGTTILSANPGFTSRSGNHYFWEFQNVGLGIHSISITLRVDTGIPLGTELTNTATVTYTDQFGQTVGGNFWSVVVTVRLPDQPPDGEEGIPFWLIATIILVAAVAIFLAFLFLGRRKTAYIDDVFLLHRDGLLIKHFARRLNPDVDSDILGGMLIAVQNFVNESFASNRGLAREGGLDELKFGRYSVMLTSGRHVVLAAVVSGEATAEVNKKIRSVVERIEKAYGRVLDKWSGDMAQLVGVERYLRDLTSTKYQGRAFKRKAL